VEAVVQAWYAGRGAGTAIAVVLFGDSDPAGRLPVTFPTDATQGSGTTPATYPGTNGTVDHDKVLLALGDATPWVTQLITYALVATTVYADEPDFDQNMELGKETFAGSGWRTALRKYMEMDDRGCFDADPLDTTYEETLDQVATGRAVGAVRVASALSELRAAAPDLTPRMTALPANDDPGDTRMPGAVSAAHGLNPDTPHRKEALAFIDFLGSARGQNLYNRSGSTLPALPNASFTVDPAIGEVAERQKAGTTIPFMDQRWPDSAVQQTHFAQVEALFAGTTDIEAALAALDRAYRERTRSRYEKCVFPGLGRGHRPGLRRGPLIPVQLPMKRSGPPCLASSTSAQPLLCLNGVSSPRTYARVDSRGAEHDGFAAVRATAIEGLLVRRTTGCLSTPVTSGREADSMSARPGQVGRRFGRSHPAVVGARSNLPTLCSDRRVAQLDSPGRPALTCGPAAYLRHLPGGIGRSGGTTAS